MQRPSCPICLEEVAPNEAAVLGCARQGCAGEFHFSCVEQAQAVAGGRCPVCRREGSVEWTLDVWRDHRSALRRRLVASTQLLQEAFRDRSELHQELLSVGEAFAMAEAGRRQAEKDREELRSKVVDATMAFAEVHQHLMGSVRSEHQRLFEERRSLRQEAEEIVRKTRTELGAQVALLRRRLVDVSALGRRCCEGCRARSRSRTPRRGRATTDSTPE